MSKISDQCERKNEGEGVCTVAHDKGKEQTESGKRVVRGHSASCE